MQVKHSTPTDTQAIITVVADPKELNSIKDIVLEKLSSRVKLPGFREGKAPLALVEKNIDSTTLQSEVLEEAVNQLYVQAIREEKLRPVSPPEISLKKFVPFTDLEFEATVAIVGEVKVADYKKIKLAKKEVKITQEEVSEVLSSLQKRMAEKHDVDRVSKNGDEVWIDFVGSDDKGQPINNADGKNYPLLLGSNTFIPGFEPNLVGLKAGDEKSFTLTFPKDYGVKSMANKKVTFAVTVQKVQEVIEPKLDDEFAKKAGPFESLKDLKTDIKRQLQVERDQQTDREFESELVREITKKSKVAVPETLITEQVDRMIKELQQNLVYRGQTYQQFLDGEGMKEDEYKKNVLAKQAEERVKASLVLTEISEAEGLDVTTEELDNRIQLLKGQYQDKAMQEELDKPENRNDIASRLLTEKTVQKLVEYCKQ